MEGHPIHEELVCLSVKTLDRVGRWDTELCKCAETERHGCSLGFSIVGCAAAKYVNRFAVPPKALLFVEAYAHRKLYPVQILVFVGI